MFGYVEILGMLKINDVLEKMTQVGPTVSHAGAASGGSWCLHAYNVGPQWVHGIITRKVGFNSVPLGHGHSLIHYMPMQVGTSVQ